MIELTEMVDLVIKPRKKISLNCKYVDETKKLGIKKFSHR